MALKGPDAMSNSMPAFDSSRPWMVTFGGFVEGTDCRTFSDHCCQRSAEDHASFLRRQGRFDVTVERRRPVPVKGAFGGWRISPGATAPHNCSLVPMADIDDWHRYAPSSA